MENNKQIALNKPFVQSPGLGSVLLLHESRMGPEDELDLTSSIQSCVPSSVLCGVVHVQTRVI